MMIADMLIAICQSFLRGCLNVEYFFVCFSFMVFSNVFDQQTDIHGTPKKNIALLLTAIN